MIGNVAILSHSLAITATVAANRFVEADGTYPAAGGNAFGVVRVAAVSGDLAPVDCLGSATVEAGGAIAVGASVKVTAAGKVLTKDSTNISVGIALTAAAADGDLLEVFLIPNAA